MSAEITVHVKSPGSKNYEVKTTPASTIAQLKASIAEVASVPKEQQRLIYSGRVLKDENTVESYKIQDGHSVHMIKSAAKKAASSTSSVTGNTSSTASSVPQNIAAGTNVHDPMNALTDARYAGYGMNLPSAESLHQMMDSESMDRTFSDPMFQETMNSMLSNPAMLDMIISQNPMLREMGPAAREMLQNPLIRETLTNPTMLRSMMNMQRSMGGAAPSFPAPGGATAGFPAPGEPESSTSTTTPTTHDSSNTTSPTNNNSTTVPPNPFAAMFQNAGNAGAANSQTNPFMNPQLLSMLGGLGSAGGATTATPAVDNRPPEERYETQLRQLNDMGFFDFDRNVNALRRSGGSVQGAIDALLNGSV